MNKKKIVVAILIMVFLFFAFIDWPSLLLGDKYAPITDPDKYIGLMQFEGYEPIDMTHIPDHCKGKVAVRNLTGKKYEMFGKVK